MNVHATTNHTPAERALIDQFETSLPGLPGDATGAARRTRAFDTLRKGLPTRKVEAWHYTDLRRLLASVPSPDAKAGAAALAPCSKDPRSCRWRMARPAPSPTTSRASP